MAGRRGRAAGWRQCRRAAASCAALAPSWATGSAGGEQAGPAGERGGGPGRVRARGAPGGAGGVRGGKGRRRRAPRGRRGRSVEGRQRSRRGQARWRSGARKRSESGELRMGEMAGPAGIQTAGPDEVEWRGGRMRGSSGGGVRPEAPARAVQEGGHLQGLCKACGAHAVLSARCRVLAAAMPALGASSSAGQHPACGPAAAVLAALRMHSRAVQRKPEPLVCGVAGGPDPGRARLHVRAGLPWRPGT